MVFPLGKQKQHQQKAKAKPKWSAFFPSYSYVIASPNLLYISCQKKGRRFHMMEWTLLNTVLNLVEGLNILMPSSESLWIP